MTDHQRADTVLPEHGCKTPNLDAFSREGIIFSESYCPSPHCCPSRATFATGLYPSMHGVWNNVCNAQALSTGLNDGVRLWSEDLKEAGYDMYFTGKWHVSNEEDPSDRGWKELNPTAIKGTHMGSDWDRWEEFEAASTERQEGEILRPGWGNYKTYGTRTAEHFGDDISTDAAIEILPELAAADKPWCMYVGLTGPHDPYMVQQKYLDLYDLDDVPLPASYADEMADKPGLYRRMRNQIWGQLSEREVREGIRHFWAFCTYLDDLFGQILQTLESTGQRDNTLVIYNSDHGDYCGDHGLFCKSIPCFDGAYHVPCIMRWPDGIERPGRREDAFVSLADYAPTFLELAGIQTERHFAGKSLVPFMKNKRPEDWRDEIHTQCNGVEVYATQRSVKTKTHKYVYNAFDFDELYDLTKDPDEMNNVQEDPAYADIKRDLVRRMWRFAHDQQDTAHNAYITIALAPYGPGEAFVD